MPFSNTPSEFAKTPLFYMERCAEIVLAKRRRKKRISACNDRARSPTENLKHRFQPKRSILYTILLILVVMGWSTAPETKQSHQKWLNSHQSTIRQNIIAHQPMTHTNATSPPILSLLYPNQHRQRPSVAGKSILDKNVQKCLSDMVSTAENFQHEIEPDWPRITLPMIIETHTEAQYPTIHSQKAQNSSLTRLPPPAGLLSPSTYKRYQILTQALILSLNIIMYMNSSFLSPWLYQIVSFFSKLSPTSNTASTEFYSFILHLKRNTIQCLSSIPIITLASKFLSKNKATASPLRSIIKLLITVSAFGTDNATPIFLLLCNPERTVAAISYTCAIIYIAAVLKPLLAILSIAIPLRIRLQKTTRTICNKQKTLCFISKKNYFPKIKYKIGFTLPKIHFYPSSLIYHSYLYRHAPSSITGTRKHDPISAHLTALKQIFEKSITTVAIKTQNWPRKLQPAKNLVEIYLTMTILTTSFADMLTATILGILLLIAGIEPNPGPIPAQEEPSYLENIHIAELNTQNATSMDAENKQQNIYLPQERQEILLATLEQHESVAASSTPFTTVIHHCYKNEQPSHPNIGLAIYQALRLCLPSPTMKTLETLLENNAIDAVLLEESFRKYYYDHLQIPEDMIQTPHNVLNEQSNAVPLSLTTWNCCKTLRDQYIAIAEIATSTPNGIICIQETKTLAKDEKAKYIKDKFPHHKLIFTSRQDYKGKISAGVLLAIPLKYTTNIMTIETTPTNLKGYYLETTFTPNNGTPCTIIGAYRPPRSAIGSHNHTVRSNLHDHLKTRLQAINHRVILMGDWNADTTRSSDRDFLNFLNENNLTSIFRNSASRPPSFKNISRIDDIYCRNNDPLLLQPEIINTPHIIDSDLTTLSDHHAVRAQLTEKLLFNTAIPAPPQATISNHVAHFVRPIPLQALSDFKHKVNIELNTSITDHNNHLQTILNNTAAAEAQSTNAINKSMALLEQIYEIANTTLPKTKPRQQAQPQQQQPQPPGGAKTFLPKAIKKKFKRALLIIRTCKKLQMATLQLQENNVIPHYLLQTLLNTKEALINLKYQAATTLVSKINTLERSATASTNLSPQAKGQLLTTINKIQHEHRITANKILKDHRQWEERREERKLRKRWVQNQRLANKEILQPTNNTGGPVHAHQLQSMQHLLFNEQANTPEGVINATTFFHRILNSTKVPQFLAKYTPWKSSALPTSLHPFKLQQKGNPDEKLINKLTLHLVRTSLFALKNNKAAGEDGIPYEILKHLPHEAVELLFHTFKLMWKAGKTPDEWKTATITLFLKKEPANAPNNYRPIAVHRAIYKLWTKVITEITQNYLDENNILSHPQEGFRRGRSTAQAAQQLVLALEDAKTHKKTLYLTKLDFSSAYNRVDHARLFEIMHQLGIPKDLITAIQSLYDQASTTIKTPIGTSSKIPQASGVIQGDNLSPLLFNIAMEPLLQWLHQENHDQQQYGYKLMNVTAFSSRNYTSNSHKTLSAIAYADDLTLITNTSVEMQHQLKKVELYAEWTGIHLNPLKCEASAIKYNSNQASTPADLQNLQIYGKNFQTNTPGHPQIIQHDTPARFLGVYISLDLNWETQFNKIQNSLQTRSEQIQTCKLTQSQKLIVEAQCLLGLVEHTLNLAPYTRKQLEQLDKIRAKCITKITKTGHCPKNAIYAPIEAFGLGKESFVERSAKAAAFNLINIMNDQGKLGTMARASHHKHKSSMAENQASGNQGNFPGRFSNYLVVRLHKITRAHNTIPKYDGNNYPVPLGELWETITSYNNLHNLQYPLDWLLSFIMIPLWSKQIMNLATITSLSGTQIQSRQEFEVTMQSLVPITLITDDHYQALTAISRILCKRQKFQDFQQEDLNNELDPVERILPPELRAPEHRSTPPTATTHINRSIDTKIFIPPPPPTFLNNINFNFEECNPDHDITPPNLNKIIVENDMAWSYNNQGQCKTAIKVAALKELLKTYHNPLADQQAAVNNLCKLLWTHAKRYESPTLKEKKIKTFDLAPQQFTMLAQAISAETNWLTNAIRQAQAPLPYYQSNEDIDTTFGTRTLPFSCKWRGSGIATLPDDPEIVAKAIKWAILSTYQWQNDPTETMPSCTSLLFKNSLNKNGIQRLLNNPRVLEIGTIEVADLHSANAWRKNETHLYKEEIVLVIIANKEGAEAYLQENLLKTFLISCYGMTADEIPTLEAMITSWKENINNETHRPLPSKQFQQATPANQLPATSPTQQSSTDIETFMNSLRTPKQLKFTNCRTIYTDGSKTATNLSAGVYDPIMGIRHIRIRSQGPSMHTAMRAELKAIHSALQTITLITQTNTLLTADAAGNIVNNNTPQPAPPPENIIILTDSQSSMHLIHTMLHYPNKLRYHKHKFLLKTIANHLLLGTQENRQSFTFCKVKAHVGIKGNEIADTAATNPEKIDNIFMDEDHPNHFCDLPNSKPTWVKLQDKQQPPQWRQANNMKEIKDAIATTSIEHLMQHNKSKKIKDLLDDDKELEQKHNTKLITTIMANQRIPQPHRSLAFKLRMRNLYTTQLAADMNQASTSTAAAELEHFCTICTSHKKETQGHILGGCTHPDMHSQHMKRHGKGAGLILQTIRDNTNVATFADAETVEKSLQKISSTFLPRSRQAETNEHKMISKPDIIIFPELTQDQTNTAPEQDKKKAIFLEISFTGDGYAAQRFQQKVTQHAAHAQFLETNQWTIEVVPIIITHSGCITNNLTTTLTNLGISNGQVKKLITKLQAHVCASNYTIIKTFRFFKRQQAERRSGVG